MRKAHTSRRYPPCPVAFLKDKLAPKPWITSERQSRATLRAWNRIMNLFHPRSLRKSSRSLRERSAKNLRPRGDKGAKENWVRTGSAARQSHDSETGHDATQARDSSRSQRTRKGNAASYNSRGWS